MHDLAGLLGAFVEVPNLKGAACVGDWDLFDEVDDPSATDLAISICQDFPVLAECRSWVHSLPPGKRPTGVVAGLIINHSKRIKEIA